MFSLPRSNHLAPIALPNTSHCTLAHTVAMPRPFAYVALFPGGAKHALFDLKPHQVYHAHDVVLIDGEPPLPCPNRLTVTFGQEPGRALLQAQAAGAATKSARLGENPSWLDLLMPF